MRSQLAVDDCVLIGFRYLDGGYHLRMHIEDETGRLLLEVHDGEIVYATDNWDVEWAAGRLVVRVGPRSIAIEVQFEPPGRIKITRGRFSRNGVHVVVRPEWLLIANSPLLMSGCSTENMDVGLRIGGKRPSPFAAIGADVPRGTVDIESAIRWAHQSMGTGMYAPIDSVPRRPGSAA